MAVADQSPQLGPPGDALVIFGITGDLARKMTLKALYDLTENGTLTVPVIGVGRSDWSDDDLHQHAREAIEARFEERGGEIDEDVFKKYADSLVGPVQWRAADHQLIRPVFVVQGKKPADMKAKDDYYSVVEVVGGDTIMPDPTLFGCKLGEYT